MDYNELLGWAKSDDIEKRRKAALECSFFPEREALTVLMELIGDENWRVRKASVESVLLFKSIITIPLLIDSLYDNENAGKRNSASEVIIKIGSQSLPTIYEGLASEDLDVKISLLNILGEVPSPTSAPHLIFYLSHEDKNIVSAAITSIGRIREPSNLPLLIEILKQSDDWIRFHCIEAIADIGGPESREVLSNLYLSKNRYKKPILKAFSRMTDTDVIPILLEEIVKNDSPLLEIMGTISSIYRANLPEALIPKHQEQIEIYIKSSFPMEAVSRIDSLWAQAQIEQKRGLILIAGLLSDMTLLSHLLQEISNPFLQRDVSIALIRFGESAISSIIQTINNTKDQQTIVVLLKVLGTMGNREALVIIQNFLFDEDFNVKSSAIEAIGSIGDKTSFEALLNLLRDEDPSYHDAIFASISSLLAIDPAGEIIIENKIKGFLGSQSEWTRRAGYKLKSMIINKDEISSLLPSLSDTSPLVRQQGVLLISEIGGEESMKILLPVLSDQDGKVRRAVLSSLGQHLVNGDTHILQSALLDQDMWVRSEAAFIMAQNEDPQLVDTLLTLLEKDIMPVKVAAIKGIGKAGCKILFGKVLEMIEDPNVEIKKAALSAIAHSNRPERDDILLKALNERNWEVKAMVVQLMGETGNRKFVLSLLRELERDTDPLVRQTTVESLRELKATEAIPRMLHYLTDPVLKDVVFSYFLSLGKAYIPVIENEAKSVDFQTKLILIEIISQLEST